MTSSATPIKMPRVQRLTPEDRIDVVEIHTGADHPLERLEFDGVRSFRQRIASGGAREAVGQEAPTTGGDLKLPAHEKNAVGIGSVVEFLPSTFGFGFATATPLASMA